MKDIGLLLLAIFISINPSYHFGSSDWPVLKGPYLGQKPPGMTPVK